MKPPTLLRALHRILTVLPLALAPVSATAGDAARFVSETINDGTIILAGTPFTKTWTLRNSGDTTWDASYCLRFASGAAMSDHLDIPVTGTVPPEGTFSFTKEMTATATAGNTREDWKLVGPAGDTIKINSSNTTWVLIYVAPTPDYAAFVSETITDASQILAGTPFVKKWTIKNKGLTTWNSGYQLRCAGGDTLSDQLPIAVSGTVPPNATFTFSKPMIAPAATGTRREDWEIANPGGTAFKVSNSSTVWVWINATSSPFTDWLTARAVPIQHYSPNADPDGDGHTSFLEYAADTDPLAAAERPDTGLIPVPAGGFGFQFTRHPDRTKLTYELQSSPDLTSWQPVVRATLGQPAELTAGATGTVTESPASGSNLRVSYQPTNGSGPRYYRIAVTDNGP